MNAETHIPSPREAVVEVRAATAHTTTQKTGRGSVSDNPPNNAESDKSARRSRAVWRGNRTRRLNKKLGPLQTLDRLTADVNTRVEAKDLDTSTARVLLQGLALRKDICLAMLRVVEVDRRLEEQDVAAEFEELKRELGLAD
jgi:hypothetical protein